jgi:DNA-directed RNA polymerase subunit M
MVEFCPKCGSLLVPQKSGDSKTVLVCRKCGFKKTTDTGNKYTLSQNIKHVEQDKILIIENAEATKTLPKVKGHVICPKCGNDEAYYWILQTRRSDEPPTRFYRCTKCNHVWREYE